MNFHEILENINSLLFFIVLNMKNYLKGEFLNNFKNYVDKSL